MTLLDCLKTLTPSEREALAASCNTSVAQLNQIAYGNRKANVFLCVDLNRATSKAVELSLLRPDINWEKLLTDLTAALKPNDAETLEVDQAA